MNRVITISREFGSGGRTIGKQTAERLGIPCYDQELIEKIEEKSGLAKEFIAERGEYTLRGGWLANAFADRSLNGLSVQDYLWTIQRKTILELAEEGPCVIVGRCADYILNGKADTLKVFIHASIESRAKRIVEKYGESSDAPEKRLRDKDIRRSSYYHFYTDVEWGIAKNYDIALDSGTLGLDRCVDIITSLY
ncbi:MAG: AAA family ATPase [Oscillospiraceae bacterium]